MLKIGMTSGMRGRFAVLYDDNNTEPIQTGLTCKTFKDGCRYCISWAKAEFGTKWRDHLETGIENGAELDIPKNKRK